MGVGSRVRRLIAAPGRVAELQRRVDELAETVDLLHRRQDAELARIRDAVNAAVDDIAARRARVDDDG